MDTNRASAWLLLLAAVVAGASVAWAQTSAPPARRPGFAWPAEMKNRKALPKGTGGEQLGQVMKTFSQSLGVRCTFCHTGTEEMPLATRDFASDANPRKNTARAMIHMVQYLNEERLPAIPGLESPQVTCYTCHRGATEPATVVPPAAPVPPPPAAPPATERGGTASQ